MRYSKVPGRKLDPSKKIELYRCLTRAGKVYSIRQGGLVVGHTVHGDDFWLKDCEFVVRPGGKARCITEQQRNVHAFVKGYIQEEEVQCTERVSYYPYEETGFVTGGGELATAEFVRFGVDGVFCAGETYKCAFDEFEKDGSGVKCGKPEFVDLHVDWDKVEQEINK